MKRVMLTGATGFIGSSVLRILSAQGVEVHAVTTQVKESPQRNVTFHQANLLDIGRIGPLVDRIQPSHLLHLAWEVNYDSPLNYEWVHSSLELIRQFRECGGERLVLAGTCYEYDAFSGFCTEGQTPLKPLTTYGKCKDVLRRWAMSYAQSVGLSTTWARIFFVYGPDEGPKRLVPSVIGSLLNDEEAPCSHGKQIRDYLHVYDVASACIALLESEAQGVVNVGSGDPVRLKEIIEIIGETLGKSDLIRMGAITPRAQEPEMIVANVNKLTNDIDWRPTFDLESGLKQTIRWWQQEQYA